MMQHTVQALQSELDNLRADNIKLYEKIKFLQSYPGRVSGCLSVCLSSSWVHTDKQTPNTDRCPPCTRAMGKLHVTHMHLAWKLENGR